MEKYEEKLNIFGKESKIHDLGASKEIFDSGKE